MKSLNNSVVKDPSTIFTVRILSRERVESTENLCKILRDRLETEI